MAEAPPVIPPALPPTTTAEQNTTTYSQRRINLIWEVTQATIAISVTTAALFVSSKLAIIEQTQAAPFLLLSNAFFLVIGFYFGRTNHQRVGGVGADPNTTR